MVSFSIGGWQVFGDPIRGRSCGSCTFCCTAVPVDLGPPGGPDDHKPAGVTCRHVCAKGCAIYERRPRPCEAWSCAWLYQPETANLKRPDQGGYVIDPMPQTILVDGHPVQGVQVWIDPARPDVHRSPALRAYLAGVAERHGMVALVRWAHPTGQEGADGMVLVAPAIPGGKWIEHHSRMIGTAEMAEKLKIATNGGQ